MSADIFNRISELERKLAALQQQLDALTLTASQKTQACENEPPKSTLSLRKKADNSHA